MYSNEIYIPCITNMGCNHFIIGNWDGKLYNFKDTLNKIELKSIKKHMITNLISKTQIIYKTNRGHLGIYDIDRNE